MADEKKDQNQADTHVHMTVGERGGKGRTPEHDHMVVDVDKKDARRHRHELNEKHYDE